MVTRSVEENQYSGALGRKEKGLVAISKRGTRAGLMEKRTLKSRPKGGEEGGHHMVIRVKNIPGRGNSRCKGPKASMSLVCVRNSRAWEAEWRRREETAGEEALHSRALLAL